MCTYPQVHIWQMQEGSLSVISAIVTPCSWRYTALRGNGEYRKWLLERWSLLAETIESRVPRNDRNVDQYLWKQIT